MGAAQPYLYEATPKYNDADPYNGFDPRVVTRASRAPPPSRKKKQEGPLIDFNRHPDSYIVLPQGQSNTKTMGARSKASIIWVRWIQLGLRALQFLTAIGILTCVICIKGLGDAEGWLMRIPPGGDIAVQAYAIYHLCRAAKGRTPTSSASYHFFALVMDAGFVPFYVFIALVSNNNRLQSFGTKDRWNTYFNNESANNYVFTANWIASLAIGSLHLLTFCLSVYLVIMFRRIARMPPDMNPLEDNLTSRRSKHKYKNSGATVTTVSEKRSSGFSDASTMSLTGKQRGSQAEDPLIPNGVPMPFFHTRHGSDNSFSPHTPESARKSRAAMENQVYAQPQSNRGSRANLHSRAGSDLSSQRDSAVDLNAKRSFATISERSENDEHSQSQNVNLDNRRVSLGLTTGNSQKTAPVVTEEMTEKRKSDLKSDNWFVHMDEDSHRYSPSPPLIYEHMVHRDPVKGAPNDSYNIGNNRRDSLDFSEDEEYRYADLPEPLRMNPPTPPVPQHASNNNHSNVYTPERNGLNRNNTTLSTMSSISRSSTPKSRYYGDLKSATANLRPVGSRPQQSVSPVGEKSPKRSFRRSKREQNEHKANKEQQQWEGMQVSGPDQSPRVISRTGLELGIDGDLGLGGGKGWGTRRRDVSGKVAEEGRGGMMLYR